MDVEADVEDEVADVEAEEKDEGGGEGGGKGEWHNVELRTGSEACEVPPSCPVLVNVTLAIADWIPLTLFTRSCGPYPTQSES